MWFTILHIYVQFLHYMQKRKVFFLFHKRWSTILIHRLATASLLSISYQLNNNNKKMVCEWVSKIKRHIYMQKMPSVGQMKSKKNYQSINIQWAFARRHFDYESQLSEYIFDQTTSINVDVFGFYDFHILIEPYEIRWFMYVFFSMSNVHLHVFGCCCFARICNHLTFWFILKLYAQFVYIDFQMANMEAYV